MMDLRVSRKTVQQGTFDKLKDAILAGVFQPGERLVEANLCEQLGAQVVAEGIETVEELRAILDTGAHYGQGFLFGRPSYPPPRASWPIDRPQRSPRGQLAREPGSSAKIRL